MDFKVEAEKNFVGRTSINASFGHVCSCSFRVLQVIVSVESVFLNFGKCSLTPYLQKLCKSTRKMR